MEAKEAESSPAAEDEAQLMGDQTANANAGGRPSSHKGVHHIDLRLVQLEDLRQVAIGSPVPVPRKGDDTSFPMIRVDGGSPTSEGSAQDAGLHDNGCQDDDAAAKQRPECRDPGETE